jgi:aminopeptidase
MEATMSDKVAWSCGGAASPKWAAKIFPELATEEEQMDALWDAIFSTTRIYGDDPSANWDKHLHNLKAYAKFLNDHDFDYLQYTDEGTDLKVGLVPGHIWHEADARRQKDGKSFLPNMPTEEVYTAPDRLRVNGHVSSKKPFVYNGVSIMDMKFTFKDGKIVDCDATTGLDTLKQLLDTDEGSRYLGEVALVAYDTPISQSGLVFYNTLYDENASCHLAFGQAYPGTIKGGNDMTEDELVAAGMNKSDNHEDFMVGSATTNIDGVTKDGKVVPIFRNGNWTDEINALAAAK